MGIEGDKSYNPNPVVVHEGQTILWVNGDAISHTVTSNSRENGVNDSGKLFDSTAILPGHFYSKVFESAWHLFVLLFLPSFDDWGGKSRVLVTIRSFEQISNIRKTSFH